MKYIPTSIILVIIAIATISCQSARLVKRGSKMEAAGMYADAADYYYQAVVAKNTNVDAKMGMKRTGQRVLDKKLSEFQKAYNQGNNKEAVYNYKDADNYFNKIKAIGVDLNFPEFYREYYDEVKDIYLNDKYVEASKLLETEKFGEAEKLFREIISIQPEYKDSKEKLNISVYEPIYRQAIEKSDNKLYRSAYYLCDRIIKGYGNYKDVYDLKAECLKKATLNLAILSVENKSTSSSINSSLEAYIIKSIQEKNNPFIKLVEANSSLSDLKLQTIVYSFVYEKGNLNEKEKTGYLKHQKTVKDEAGNNKTVTEYEKVKYKEFSMGRSVKISYTYKLINVKNGQIIATNSHTLVSEDNIYYAEYNGDKKKLVPGYWKSMTTNSSEDYVKDNYKEVNELQSLLNARKVIKDYNTLADEVLKESSEKIATAVNNYNPEQ